MGPPSEVLSGHEWAARSQVDVAPNVAGLLTKAVGADMADELTDELRGLAWDVLSALGDRQVTDRAMRGFMWAITTTVLDAHPHLGPDFVGHATPPEAMEATADKFNEAIYAGSMAAYAVVKDVAGEEFAVEVQNAVVHAAALMLNGVDGGRS